MIEIHEVCLALMDDDMVTRVSIHNSRCSNGCFSMINTGNAPDQEHQKLIWFAHSIFQRHTERVCALQLLN